MKYFDWDEQKNAKLKAERDICFEDVLIALAEEKLLDDISHPNQKDYKGQRVIVIEINGYVFLVPYVEDEEKYFLKTMYPSRKFTGKYHLERNKS